MPLHDHGDISETTQAIVVRFIFNCNELPEIFLGIGDRPILNAFSLLTINELSV